MAGSAGARPRPAASTAAPVPRMLSSQCTDPRSKLVHWQLPHGGASWSAASTSSLDSRPCPTHARPRHAAAVNVRTQEVYQFNSCCMAGVGGGSAGARPRHAAARDGRGGHPPPRRPLVPSGRLPPPPSSPLPTINRGHPPPRRPLPPQDTNCRGFCRLSPFIAQMSRISPYINLRRPLVHSERPRPKHRLGVVG